MILPWDIAPLHLGQVLGIGILPPDLSKRIMIFTQV